MHPMMECLNSGGGSVFRQRFHLFGNASDYLKHALMHVEE